MPLNDKPLKPEHAMGIIERSEQDMIKLQRDIGGAKLENIPHEPQEGILSKSIAEGIAHVGRTLAFPTEQIPKNVKSSLTKTAGVLQNLDKDILSAMDFVSPMGAMVKAFHGSPFKFKTFDKAKVGTGEGAQAFGHGLYFTESKDIAKHYAKNVHANIDPQMRISEEASDIFRALKSGKTVNGVKMDDFNPIGASGKSQDDLIRDYSKDLATANVSKKMREQSENVYSVTIHKGKTPDQYDYLRWDQKVNPIQARKIATQRAKLTGKDISQREIDNLTFQYKHKNGREMYEMLRSPLGDDKNVSDFLLEAGIDGIKYPSGTLSGIKSSDKFNYVVFDPNAVTIEEISNLK